MHLCPKKIILHVKRIDKGPGGHTSKRSADEGDERGMYRKPGRRRTLFSVRIPSQDMPHTVIFKEVQGGPAGVAYWKGIGRYSGGGNALLTEMQPEAVVKPRQATGLYDFAHGGEGTRRFGNSDPLLGSDSVFELPSHLHELEGWRACMSV